MPLVFAFQVHEKNGVPARSVRAGENFFSKFLQKMPQSRPQSRPQLRYKIWDYRFSLLENSDVPIAKTMQIIPASLSTRLRGEFVVSRPDRQTQQVDVVAPASIVHIWMQTTTSVSKSLEVLDDEFFADKYGLRLVKIGANSPFLRLAIPGDAILRGTMEIGDRIVAINGLLARHPDDLEALRIDHRRFEICIFDHRTHQTVSWELKAIDELYGVVAKED